jgi:hypothetical protein
VIAAVAVLVFLLLLWGAVPLAERATSRKHGETGPDETR